jgi:hypothetical protein
MVAAQLPGETNGTDPRSMLMPFIRIVAQHGVWAVLFTALLVWVLMQGAKREEVLMDYQRQTIPVLQQLGEDQRDTTAAIERLDNKVDKLLERK